MLGRRLGNAFLLSVMALALSGIASAAPRGRDHDRDDNGYYRGRDGRAYQNGLRRGQRDRADNRRYNYRRGVDWDDHDGAWHAAYRQGYDEGYYGGYPDGEVYGGNYPYPAQAPYGPYGQGPYAQGPYGYGRQAYQQGFQDGVNDGRNDFFTGHSYRPTHDSNYKHASSGYYSGWGSKQAYKQEYRSGYLQGYAQGYRSNGGYGYRR